MTRLVLLTCLLVGLTACPDNQYKASTWTKKLDDPREVEVAVTHIEQLGDPSAIPALGKAWQDQGKPVRMLQVIIGLARPLTPKQAADTYMTDFEKTGRKASWDAAMPFLVQALSEVDEADPRSVDSAQKAADAIGESKSSDGLDALIELANKQATKKLITAQVSAIRAIGEFDTEKPKATAALIKLLDKDPPPNPRTAPDKDKARLMAEKYGLFLGISGASINALGNLRAPTAVPVLVLAMYRTPDLFTQVRRALVACGPTAEDELRKILRGEDAPVNQLFADKKLDTYCGDHNDEPPDQCQKMSTKDFYPAVVLGDFYDPASVPDLLVALDRPVLPQYYQDDQPSSTTQYSAIFDALRKIGAASAADKVRSMWMGHAAPAAAPKRGRHGRPQPAAPADAGGGEPDMMTRILAVGAYPFVAHDTTGVDELGKIAFDNHQDINFRTEAATAFARLSRDPAHIRELNDLAGQYYKQADDYRAKANGKPLADKEASDKEFQAAEKRVEDAKAAALKATHDNSKSADDIRAATDVAKKAQDDFDNVKKKHAEAIGPWKELDAKAKGLRYTGRMFQTHIARIEVALRCGDKLDCYAATLKETADDARTHLTKYIPDLKVTDKKDPRFWTKDDALGLHEGEVERAMLELGKQGTKASAYTDALLDAAKSDDRLIRQSVLLALPKIATKPCEHCEEKLDDAIKSGEGKSTLADLNLETTMLRNYFAWAGGATPKADDKK